MILLQEWITFIFDHPTDGGMEKAWYWSEDAPEWQGAREQIPALIAETFEHGGELLARFSDEQLDQGFWFLAGATDPQFMHTLVDPKILLATRLRASRSFVPLFEQVMAARCSANFCHLDEDANPLNDSCYMWWDLLWFQLTEDIDTEILITLRRLLAVPHDACRESALHGLGHWARRCPQAADIVDEFLSSASGLRPEIIAYAERARIGGVL
jgi:hypothetical protein